MINHLYIECTHTAESGLNTGIQRVVRKIINQLGNQLPDGTPITLVTINHGAFYPLVSLPDFRPINIIKAKAIEADKIESDDDGSEEIDLKEVTLTEPVITLKSRMLSYLRRTRMAITAKISWKPLHTFLAAPRTQFGLSGIIYTFTLRPFHMLKRKAALKLENDATPKPIKFSQGDMILMLDSSWHLPAWGALTNAKKSGAAIMAVIYDLIPITHPQFCEESLTKVFNTWFEQAKSQVDGYIAISQTIQNSLQEYLASVGAAMDGQRLGYFYLGADIAESQEHSRDRLKNNISENDSYLIVSTIEPRKNHQYLVDAFTQLWQEGHQIKLHIVGRVGWKVDKLLKQIEQHPHFNKQLFIWNDLDDSELVYCYKHSKALVFPSFVEGFGLPIIEAQHFDLPVLASDTPIHREVGGDSIIYFDLDKTQDLVDKVTQIEAGTILLKHGAKFDPDQFTWQRSAEMLAQEIQRIKKVL